MFTGNGAANNSDRGKATIREFCAKPTYAQVHQFNTFNIHTPHFPSPTLPPDAHPSQVQYILNTAAPMKPVSYMSLLTASDDKDDTDILSKDMKDQHEQINHMILLHSENLRHTLGCEVEKHHREVHRRAEERAAKKQKEKEAQLSSQNTELERLIERYRGEAGHYKAQAEGMGIRVRYLECAKRSLTKRLHEANAFQHYMEMEQEEAESSFPDPGRVLPIMLDCKVCERQLATVMLWPCRHVCVCTQCEAAARLCPICRGVKTHSVEVHLPLN